MSFRVLIAGPRHFTDYPASRAAPEPRGAAFRIAPPNEQRRRTFPSAGAGPAPCSTLPVSPVRVWEGGDVVIDYRDAWVAAAAVQALEGKAEVVLVRVAVSDDPTVTQLLVHRVAVTGGDAERARAVLAECGLLDPWWLCGHGEGPTAAPRS